MEHKEFHTVGLNLVSFPCPLTIVMEHLKEEDKLVIPISDDGSRRDEDLP
jgi:hypothetical protein